MSYPGGGHHPLRPPSTPLDPHSVNTVRNLDAQTAPAVPALPRHQPPAPSNMPPYMPRPKAPVGDPSAAAMRQAGQRELMADAVAAQAARAVMAPMMAARRPHHSSTEPPPPPPALTAETIRALLEDMAPGCEIEDSACEVLVALTNEFLDHTIEQACQVATHQGKKEARGAYALTMDALRSVLSKVEPQAKPGEASRVVCMVAVCALCVQV